MSWQRIATILGILVSISILIPASWQSITWAGDQRWVTHEAVKMQELRALEREAAKLKIEIDEGTATSVDRIYYTTTLKPQIDQLKREVEASQ